MGLVICRVWLCLWKQVHILGLRMTIGSRYVDSSPFCVCLLVRQADSGNLNLLLNDLRYPRITH